MDIRVILEALHPEDRALWSKHRTDMRRTYMAAHSATLRVDNWQAEDDAFLDLIDIKLAILFDRSGKITMTEEAIAMLNSKQGHGIEQDIANQNKRLSQSPSQRLLPTVDQNKQGWNS